MRGESLLPSEVAVALGNILTLVPLSPDDFFYHRLNKGFNWLSFIEGQLLMNEEDLGPELLFKLLQILTLIDINSPPEAEQGLSGHYILTNVWEEITKNEQARARK